MKFTCLQENLAKGLGVVSKAVPAKSPLPVLTNILISAEKGRLKLAATDLDTSIVTYIGVSLEKEGSIYFFQIILREYIQTY